jgi:hypothetical protein
METPRQADIKILPQSVGWFCFDVEIIEEGFFFLVFQRKEIVLNDAEYIYFQPSSFNYHAITCFCEARSQLEAIHSLCCQSSFLQITNVSCQVEPSYQFSAPNTCPGKRYSSFIFR